MVRHSCLHSYADDTQLYLSFYANCANEAEEKINSDLNEISEWSKTHALMLNPSKSNIMTVGSRNQLVKVTPLTVTLSGHQINSVDFCKNLGLYMDKNLNFNEHINKLLKLSFGKLRSLYRFKYILSPEIKLRLVESLILSAFNYCDVVYGPCINQATSYLIQKFQNTCLRYVYNINRRDHISPYLKFHKILNMSLRRNLHIACFVHNLITTGQPDYLRCRIKYLSEHHHKDTRSQSKTLSIESHETNFYEKSFTYVSASTYNNIPRAFKDLKKEAFRKNVRGYLLEST